MFCSPWLPERCLLWREIVPHVGAVLLTRKLFRTQPQGAALSSDTTRMLIPPTPLGYPSPALEAHLFWEDG